MIKKRKGKIHHKPVLLKEVIEVLQIEKVAHLHSNAQFIDATLGYGGHSSEFIKKGIFVVGIEADQEAISYANRKLLQACPTPQSTERCFKIIHDNFRNIARIASEQQLDNIIGILFDLGVSSPQLTSELRGFSFQNEDAPLDMRMDTRNQSVTAADLLNSLPQRQLFEMFKPYIDYRSANKLARKIVSKRIDKKFATVGDLIEITKSVQNRSDNLNPVTLPFMALRIAVNSELQNIQESLPEAFRLLKPTGRLAVISFHSEEDRIVKTLFNQLVGDSKAYYPFHKFITPSEDEIKTNPRARSAKLRVIEKNEI